jgi:ribonuclease Z
MYPGKYRSVPGILLQTKMGFVGIDIGEGYFFQLQRLHGESISNYILQNMFCIFISHFHGDHSFGLPHLLKKRSEISADSIPIIGSEVVLRHLLSCQSFTGDLKFHFISDWQSFRDKDVEIHSFPVNHCNDSHGALIIIEDQYRVAYSGDRNPKDNFVNEIGECHLLIHEATFSDDLIENAEKGVHSTVSMAVESGRNCQYIILTHFSQRCSKLPEFGGSNNIAFAFDYLSFKWEQMAEVCQMCMEVFETIRESEHENEDSSA